MPFSRRAVAPCVSLANRWSLLLMLVVAIFLPGCAPYQATINANQLVSNIDTIRETQIIYNINRAIDDPSMIPSQVVIATGSAQASTGVTSSLNIATHWIKSFSVNVPDSWTSTWSLTPVTDGSDLQNLRAVYQFIVTDHPILATQTTRLDKVKAATATLQLSSQILPSKQPPPPPQTPSTPQTPLDITPVPTPTQAANMLIGGQSWECQKYQSEKDVEKLYNQWLFWFRDGSWHPTAPNSRHPLIPLDRLNNIYITSRACFDDFIILAQSLIPSAHAAAANSSKVPITIPAPAGS